MIRSHEMLLTTDRDGRPRLRIGHGADVEIYTGMAAVLSAFRRTIYSGSLEWLRAYHKECPAVPDDEAT